MAWAPGEGRGGGFQKWGSVPGPLFCVRTDVATKGAGTQILARKFFSRKKFPPHMCSQNDQRDVGIILRHGCWGRTPPPPGTAGRAAPAQTPPPGTATKEGEGGGGWANGLPCHPPPPPAKQFSSRPALSPVRGSLGPPEGSAVVPSGTLRCHQDCFGRTPIPCHPLLHPTALLEWPYTAGGGGEPPPTPPPPRPAPPDQRDQGSL